ncbi:MAG: YIP1 family protein [Thermodesulfovibrionales bacterium]|nr:YIP1 family protein [Thermodesulfovibrionales bacterium]
MFATITPISQFIGSSFIGYSFMGTLFRLDSGSALASAIISYVLSLLSIYIIALIADALAPKFASKKNILNAFKAVVYSMTPSRIACILYIMPSLSILAFLAGLYGIYLFYLGLPLMMDTPKEKSTSYIIVVIIVTIVVNIVIGAIAEALISPLI